MEEEQTNIFNQIQMVGPHLDSVDEEDIEHEEEEISIRFLYEEQESKHSKGESNNI